MQCSCATFKSSTTSAFAAKALKGSKTQKLLVAQPISAKMNTNDNKKDSRFSAVSKTLGAAALAGYLAFMPMPAQADIDLNTFKAGVKSTIEASPIQNQSAADVVRALKDKVLPDVEAKLSQVSEASGSKYPQSVVKELETVRGELDSLEKEIASGSDSSNVKSAASGIEQQLNALKANLGFD